MGELKPVVSRQRKGGQGYSHSFISLQKIRSFDVELERKKSRHRPQEIMKKIVRKLEFIACGRLKTCVFLID